MKILLLTDGVFPFQIGGMQRHSSILIELLLKQGIFVHVMHCGGLGYSKEEYLRSFNKSQKDLLIETYIEFPKLFRFPGHYIRANRNYSANLYYAIKEDLKNYDLIYAQGFTGSHFTKTKSDHEVPILVNLHGLEMFQLAPNLKAKLQYLLLAIEAKHNLFGADYVYSFGGKLSDILIKLGVQKNKIIQNSNGIPEDYLIEESNLAHKKNNKKIEFLFIGRNERRKGAAELKEAITKIINNQERELDFIFNFVGPIEDKNKLSQSNIIYHGEIRDMQKMLEIIDNCDCLVCPSYAEGMPTVILEAMARGLAIIATDVGATSRMIEGNGILLEKPDVLELSQAMKTIIDLPKEDLIKMKTKSIDLVREKFTWKQVVQNKIEDFKKIINKA